MPIPANDDFANATVLTGETLSNGVYSAGASGNNWGASKEAGEPAHAGDPGGASVWYSWTAPSTGTYGLSACGRFASLFGVYTGSSLATLAPVGASTCGSSGLILLQASAGTTYRIAVDGRLDSQTGSPAMGSVSVHVFHDPPSRSFVEPPPFSEVVPRRRKRKPINTSIGKRKIDSERRQASFRFGSNEKEARFRCQLDKRSPTWCKSPKTYKHLSPGRHVFKVAAIDPASSGDATPATARFKIAPPR